MTPYAEFGVTTNFSFLRAGSHPEEYVTQAKALGYAAIGVADRNTFAGVVRAHTMAKEAGVRFLPGCRLVFVDGRPDILAYPSDREAYGRLCRMLTRGNLRAEKGACHLGLDDLEEWSEGQCLALLPPKRIGDSFRHTALRLQDAAPDRLWLGATMPHRGDDARRLAGLRDLGARLRLPLLALGDALYHIPDRRPLQDVVTCIREHVTIDTAGRLLEANAERHLKSPAEMARLFRRAPEAIPQTLAFLDRLSFSLDQLRYDYPHEHRQGYATPQEALAAMAREGAEVRYPDGVPDKVRYAIERELGIIADLKFAPYFLTVRDIVLYARRQGILCQGRGSAANSAVCFCLGLTEVDPMRSSLLFERFISENRGEPPDIDVDFEHERRGEVLQYVYDAYGNHRAGLAATTITYRSKSAIREAGKVFGLSDDTVSALTGSVWGWSTEDVKESQIRQAGLDPADRRFTLALALASGLRGFPRHLSQHVGGMVVTEGRLDELVPLTQSGMQERPILEWNKDDLEELGLLKIDVLALGMLTAIQKCFGLLEKHYGHAFRRICDLPPEDEAVYRMLRRADSIGVFQVESRAQQSMLPRLRPEKFDDLVTEVAIVRPGPIQGGMVHPFLRRKQGLEPVTYPSPELEEVLSATLGVPLFQEQVMQIAMVAAGFTAAEADKLRRAMATFRRVGTIGQFHQKLKDGMAAKGYTPEFAESLWQQIQGFGSYGFPRSHAESFALLVYASSWIKCHYPDVFCAGLLNAWPMGFYAPAQLIRDAEEHGVELRGVDILRSDWDHTLEACDEEYAAPPSPLTPIPSPRGEGGTTSKALAPRHIDMAADIWTTRALRLGFRQVEGLREADAQIIVEKRGAGYDSIRDLWLRTGLSPAVLERLARADAFRSLGLDRRAALWAIRGLSRAGDQDDLPLFRAVHSRLEADVALPALTLGEHVIEDYRHLKLSLKAHPVSFVRNELDALGIVPNARLPELPSGRRITVAGLVIVRQRPGTANGVIFMTMEDETAWSNAIVWPSVFETFRPTVLGARLVGITGKLQNEHGVIHVVAERLEDLSSLLDRVGERGSAIEALMQSDEQKRPPPEGRAPRSERLKNFAKAQSVRPTPGSPQDAMPKGRNFH